MATKIGGAIGFLVAIFFIVWVYGLMASSFVQFLATLIRKPAIDWLEVARAGLFIVGFWAIVGAAIGLWQAIRRRLKVQAWVVGLVVALPVIGAAWWAIFRLREILR